MKKEILILMYNGFFVNTTMLNKGIYNRKLPCIYEIGTTIKGIEQQGKDMVDKLGSNFLSKSYFDNLRQCELVKFKLIEL